MIRKELTICAAGLKGAFFIEELLRHAIKPTRIFSYSQNDDASASFERIASIALGEDIEFSEVKHPHFDVNDLILIVGWQYLLTDLTQTCIVFHDSLLPRYRGFSPTVTALINGDKEVGVTALIPNQAIDSGPIVAQASFNVEYPMTIAKALKLQAALMAKLAVTIYDQFLNFEITARQQRGEEATYSIWRDEEDYEIDWKQSSQRICRFVDAVGHPYAGARTTVCGEVIIVDSVSIVNDLDFEERHPGKVWQIAGGRPIVVCGSGLLRIDSMRTQKGRRFELPRMRIRMGRP